MHSQLFLGNKFLPRTARNPITAGKHVDSVGGGTLARLELLALEMKSR